MKNAIVKDTFREIRRTLSKFLSIFAIVAIGVSFFAGIKATAPDMKITADKYFDDYRLMDIKLASTMGFVEEDIQAIKKVPNLEGVFPTYSMDALVNVDSKDLVLKVLALPTDKLNNPDESYINRVKLVEGRYPEKPNECLTERVKMLGDGMAIGSKIKLSSGNDDDINNKLKEEEYTIVGVVETPYYLSFERGTSSIGNGKVNSFIMVPQENFKMEVYTDVFLTIEGVRDLLSYDKEYEDAVTPVREALEKVGEDREKARYNEIISEANEKLNDSRKELQDSEKKGKDELKKASEKLDDGKAQIAKGEKELKDKEIEADKAFKEGEAKLREEYKKLQAGEKEYNLQLQNLNAIKAQGGLEASQVAQMEMALANTGTILDASKKQLDIESEKLKVQKEKAKKEFQEGYRKLASSKKELEKGVAEYEKQKKEFESKIAEGYEKIADAEKEIKDIKEPTWYVLDRNKHVDFVDYGYAADRIDAIAQVFPVFFFLIAALVCLTTMTRMVDEQRTHIGTLKALGYNKMTIASKYLLYALLASISGSIFGLLVGFKVFPTVIFNAYGIMYTLPPVIAEFNVYYAILSTSFAVLTTTIAAWFACYKELAETPAILMRPKAPRAGKRILLERITFLWSRMNFTQKVTARNLLRYKKRFFMTVLGVGGCTALLLTGFGVKDSIESIVSKQFEELYKYDMVISLKEDLKLEDSNTVLGDILKDHRIKDYIFIREQNIDVAAGKEEKSASLYVTEDTKKIEDFITFKTRTGKEKLSLNDEGVILTEKLAKLLQVRVGDEIDLKDGDTSRVTVKVSGITEHYLSHYVYMSPKLYESVYGKEVKFKQVIAKIANTNEDFQNQLSTDFMKDTDNSSVTFTSGISESFDDMIGSLNYVILVLIVSAGALAFVVLYNLTNVNVTERLREIATIKVLGFYDNEVSSYVYRENFILTIIGTLTGLVMGVFLHRFVTVTTEMDYIMFGRNIDLLSYLYSAILTMVFSGMVNFVMYFKLKDVGMVESLKSVD